MCDLTLTPPFALLSGDSPKVAGCMDLFRVQGRWGPAARLAWIRCVLKTSTDVCGGSQLSKTAVNTFPSSLYFDLWADIIEAQFMLHVNNIIKSRKAEIKDMKKLRKASNTSQNSPSVEDYQYRIDALGERQLVKCLVLILSTSLNRKKDFKEVNPSIKNATTKGLNENTSNVKNYSENQNTLESKVALRTKLQISDWSDPQLISFLSCTVRGFLRCDLYTSMTEFLSRAEGSFGLQVKAFFLLHNHLKYLIVCIYCCRSIIIITIVIKYVF